MMARQMEAEGYFPKCYGVLPLCLKTDATPHYHCPISVKCSFVSFEHEHARLHVNECTVKPPTIPEESYLICSKSQAFCVAGQDRAKKSTGQKHFHCAGYPDCMHVNSRLNAMKNHIFTCENLATRLDLYPVCSELACRHQYDETKFHYHCDTCEWTTDEVDEIEKHRARCFGQSMDSDEGGGAGEEEEEEGEYPVVMASVEDDSVVINLNVCRKVQCMKRIDIKNEVQEHYHCPACEFCGIKREGVLDHFQHLHCNALNSDTFIPKCYALDHSCCAEEKVQGNKTVMAPILHYHCPTCKEFSDCRLNLVRAHFLVCQQHEAPGKRQKLGSVQLFGQGEELVTEIVPSATPLAPQHFHQTVVVEEPFDHRIIECTGEWKGCAVNRGMTFQHYHCPYCTWSNSLLVNIQAHKTGCLEKLSAIFEERSTARFGEDEYESPVEFPVIDSISRKFINIIPCFKRLDSCAGTSGFPKSGRIHWHCPICTLSGGKASMIKHFAACLTALSTDLKDATFSNQKRKEMDPSALRNSDSEDSETDFEQEYTVPDQLTSVIRCYKKLPICRVDDLPGRPIHYHCGICSKPDLNKRALQQHQIGHCLRSRARALREKVDPNEDKFKNPPNVIVCRQREASCNTTDSKRVTHFHCSVCSYVSYRKDRAENHVQKAHISKAFDLDSSNSPAKVQMRVAVLPPAGSAAVAGTAGAGGGEGEPANDPCLQMMERCEQDIRICKGSRKVDPRRRAHWHCRACDFVDYKRYRIRSHIIKNHMAPCDLEVELADTSGGLVEDEVMTSDEEDEVHGVFSCTHDHSAGTAAMQRAPEKHWHCSLCGYTGPSKVKAQQHHGVCLKRCKKDSRNFVMEKNKELLKGNPDRKIVEEFRIPEYSHHNSSPLVFCSNNVYQCTYPLNTRIDDMGYTEHWHCPICDKVGFDGLAGIKHYVHCSNFVEFHVKSQMPGTLIDFDILQCSREYTECAPHRKCEEKKAYHFHCPLCPYVDWRKRKVTLHYTEVCSGKAASTHIMYCTAAIEKCSSGELDSKEGRYGHWHCSLCAFIDYNQKKVAAHYRDCFVAHQKYGSRVDSGVSVSGAEDSGSIVYPDIASLSDRELTLLKIIPCSRKSEGCEGPEPGHSDQSLHYHCPICTKSDYLQPMLRHFPRCIRYLSKKRKSSGSQVMKVSFKKKKKNSKSDMKKERVESLGCQLVDKAAGIFVVRGSAVGLGFPVHVIFKKTHPKEFHCESGCEMQDRQLCKHLSAVERYVRENNLYKEEDDESTDLNEDFPDLDQIELFHRITDDEKCDVYTLHNYCLDNNTPVIRPFQTFKYPDGEETSCTFYSVCNAMFKGYFTRSGRVITTYNKKTQKYLCKCFYKECVHTTVTKLYRASQGLKDCYGSNNQGSVSQPMKTVSAHHFLENLYDDDQRRYLKSLSEYD